MNLHAFLSRGAAHAPKQEDPVSKAVEQTRQRWLNALLVDMTRAWLSLDDGDCADVVNGLTTMLAIAGFAHAYDARSVDTLEIRIIRGAISAAGQCLERGGVIAVDDAKAFHTAAEHARDILGNASHMAIIHAATEIRHTVGLDV